MSNGTTQIAQTERTDGGDMVRPEDRTAEYSGADVVRVVRSRLSRSGRRRLRDGRRGFGGTAQFFVTTADYHNLIAEIDHVWDDY